MMDNKAEQVIKGLSAEEYRRQYNKQWRKDNPEYSKRWKKDNPEKVNKYSRQWYRDNVEKARERNKQWRDNNPDKIKKDGRQSRLKCYYGISLEEYYEMHESQNNCCAICGIHQNELKGLLCIDHNHITGEIRGLLCGRCNRFLGNIYDDTNTLKKMITYLKR